MPINLEAHQARLTNQVKQEKKAKEETTLFPKKVVINEDINTDERDISCRYDKLKTPEKSIVKFDENGKRVATPREWRKA